MFTQNTQYTNAPQNIYSCPDLNIAENCVTISVGLTSSIISSYQASLNVFHRITEYQSKTALIQNGFAPRHNLDSTSDSMAEHLTLLCSASKTKINKWRQRQSYRDLFVALLLGITTWVFPLK